MAALLPGRSGMRHVPAALHARPCARVALRGPAIGLGAPASLLARRRRVGESLVLREVRVARPVGRRMRCPCAAAARCCCGRTTAAAGSCIAPWHPQAVATETVEAVEASAVAAAQNGNGKPSSNGAAAAAAALPTNGNGASSSNGKIGRAHV